MRRVRKNARRMGNVKPKPGSFEETWQLFEFYWRYLDEHPGATFEEAEKARLSQDG